MIREHTQLGDLVEHSAEIDLDGVKDRIDADAVMVLDADLVARVGAGAVGRGEGMDIGGCSEDGSGGGEEGAEEEGRVMHYVK